MNVSNIEVHTDPVCRMQVDEKFGVHFISWDHTLVLLDTMP